MFVGNLSPFANHPNKVYQDHSMHPRNHEYTKELDKQNRVGLAVAVVIAFSPPESNGVICEPSIRETLSGFSIQMLVFVLCRVSTDDV